jgi:hypothetical protein
MNSNNPHDMILTRLQEASMGTSMTAEKVPTGGFAHNDNGNEGGGDGEHENECHVEVICVDGDCEAVLKAIAALKDAGAQIKCVKKDGEEVGAKKKEGEEHEGKTFDRLVGKDEHANGEATEDGEKE